MTTATINSNASGVWIGEEGTEVEVIERKVNGRAVLVRMPEKPQRLTRHAGRDCWLPAGWVDEKEPEPTVCPYCGRPLEESC